VPDTHLKIVAVPLLVTWAWYPLAVEEVEARRYIHAMLELPLVVKETTDIEID
jgi:hypothetical protein